MAVWQSVLPNIVRHLIGDFSTSQTFTDARITQGIVVAGLMVAQEHTFAIDYTFDLESYDITPDPVAYSYNDAIALFTLKTACMLNQNQYITATGTGIKVKDGDSSVDTTAGFGGYKDILTLGPCAAYQKLLKSMALTRSMNAGGAVMSPFSHENSNLTMPTFGVYARQLFDSLGRC